MDFYTKEIKLGMENKLTQESLIQYSSKVAEKICSDFFANKRKINGKEILNVSPSMQLNIFSIKNLFDIWALENEKLKSTYFNYEAPEVRKALGEFLNIVSKNIEVDKQHFEPLVKASVENTLLLMLSPYNYFSNEIKKPGRENISLNEIKSLAKYILINKKLINAFIARLEEKSISQLNRNEAFNVFSDACAVLEDGPDDTEIYAAELNKIIPMNVDDFMVKDLTEVSHSNLRNIAKKEEQGFHITLNDKFSSQGNKIEFGRHKIESIKASLSINQRFLFTNELFEGDKQQFYDVVDELDKCETLEAVWIEINKKYKKKYGWEYEDDAFKEFIETIERKFL